MLAVSSIQKRDIESRVIIEKKDYGDNRNPYLHDHDRILYSRTFRRLAFKTQVVPAFGIITSDHIRSRLTHSLEVMQIASSIALETKKAWINGDKLDIDLIHAIALGHDLGHTAYGHIGEGILFEFIFRNDSNDNEIAKNFEYLNCKIRHSFQSLKICCFLEKQYKPDFCGLNLTIATLDGILKHSNMEEKEKTFYKEVFESYQKIFLENIDIDKDKKEKLNNILFGYFSPVTYEGIIVSIADEIAQLCHDIEDIRRLGKFKGVKDFYITVNRLFYLTDLPKNMQEVYDDFNKEFNEVLKNPEENIIKLERLYIKLILGICVPLVSKMMQRLADMDETSREQLLKYSDLGTFKHLQNKDLQQKLKLELTEIKLIECLAKIFAEYKKALTCLPAVAKWDMKGKELYLELHNIIYKAFNDKTACKNNNETNNEINLKILEYDERENIKKSYYVGKDFEKSLILGEQKIDGIPIKFAVWDYLAGMTDNFIIKSYEELTFKRVELR